MFIIYITNHSISSVSNKVKERKNSKKSIISSSSFKENFLTLEKKGSFKYSPFACLFIGLF